MILVTLDTGFRGEPVKTLVGIDLLANVLMTIQAFISGNPLTGGVALQAADGFQFLMAPDQRTRGQQGIQDSLLLGRMRS